ncbi:MAG: hypothetical protein GTO02_06230, partial [Candidatus Dadabacteria bacterium]|nr:hypothetical protein [Candidatus Dadabacteria bacterium]NIQ13998.1 hypothetical protein [Candidatus Dadabacteria bacterium]
EDGGLLNGKLYGVAIEGVVNEDRQNGFGINEYLGKARFKLVSLGDLSLDKDGMDTQKISIESGVTQFLRIEDGSWNPVQG